MKKRLHFLYVSLVILLLTGSSCQRKLTVFEVNEQEVRTDQINKDAFKSELNLLQTAWSDLFNSNMPGPFLNQTVNDLNAVNDRSIIVDRVLRHMLNRSELVLPTNTQMRADIDKFVAETYNKFYHRAPSSFEAWKLKQLIESDQNMLPVHVYMSFLSSDEYSRS